jgi:uncharacterized protein (TIGR00251 family)
MVERIIVKLTPKASRDEVKGWAVGADSKKILKCSVTAPPDKGKANEALIELLAGHFGVAKSAIRLIKGQMSRQKLIEIHRLNGNPAAERH